MEASFEKKKKGGIMKRGEILSDGEVNICKQIITGESRIRV